MSRHGYGSYTRGCRCDTCRAAKREYQRTRRIFASVERHNCDGTHIVDGITHGLAGYQEFHCRCETCATAKSSDDRDRRARRAS